MTGIIKISLKTFLECVRLRTFGRYGLQQIQVDCHYLQMYLWRFVSDENLVHFLLDEIVGSSAHRCLDPAPMEQSVIEVICERGWGSKRSSARKLYLIEILYLQYNRMSNLLIRFIKLLFGNLFTESKWYCRWSSCVWGIYTDIDWQIYIAFQAWQASSTLVKGPILCKIHFRAFTIRNDLKGVRGTLKVWRQSLRGLFHSVHFYLVSATQVEILSTCSHWRKQEQNMNDQKVVSGGNVMY